MRKRTRMTNKKQNRFLLIFIISALIIIIAGVAYLRAPASAPTASGSLRVSLEDAKAAFDADTALFIDVRSQQAFSASHIKNAQLLPLPDMIGGSLPSVEKNALIYTYCT